MSLLLVLAACGSSPKRDPAPEVVPPIVPPAPVAVQPVAPANGLSSTMDCLPLIGCGCFMQCSMGALEEPADGEWKVDYYDTMVMAKIEQHCVDGKCDKVFAVHTCQKTCTPAALNVKCVVDRGVLITCKQRP